jgi:hypothetical protein
MNFIHRMWNGVVGNVQTNSNSRLKVLNCTRQTVLGTSIEVADRGATRRKGLLGRSSLPSGEGIWIVPCESVHTFWMKFPIDLVYLDRDKKVKKVRSRVVPWRLSACLSAHSVLEFASGTIDSTRTMPGDRLEFFPASEPSDCRISPDVSMNQDQSMEINKGWRC